MSEEGWTDREPLLPAQFFSVSRNNECSKLMLAVLHQAINDWGGYGILPNGTGITYGSARRRKIKAEVGWWLFEDESDQPFSFFHVCEVLGIDSDYLRNGLRHFHGRIERRPQVITERRSQIRPTRKRVRVCDAHAVARGSTTDAVVG